MQVNVVKNAKRNVAFGAINRIIIMLCPFVERAVIQNVLGAQFLGLGSLYTSIISVLSLTELGFSSAMVYNMYKPAAEGNVKKMNALLNFYRKTYWIIGCVILVIGLLLIPFLPKLINGSYPDEIDIVKLYLIYLGNTAISYFLFAYLQAVIVVHQRDDINSLINSIVKIGLTASQIAVLYISGNYFLFTCLMPCFTLLNNLFIGWRVHSTFPQYKPSGTLTKEDKEGIKKIVTGTFIQQACAVTRNSLDSICISAFLGLTLTAIYNNYFVILTGVSTFTGIVTTSFMGGIGNHVATKSVEDNYQEMKRLDFLYLWIGGWFAICLLCLYQPFMELWMGLDMMLPMPAVVLLCLYFYILKLGDIRSMYSSAKGLWWEQRYRALGETLLNLIMNIVLGKLFGVYGIIIATIISLFLCNYLWSAGITFRLYFSICRRRNYYEYQLKQSTVIVATASITYFTCIFLPISNVLSQLITRAIICMIVPNTIFYIIYHKSETFKYAKSKLLGR